MWILRIVGAVYLLSACWCMLRPEMSASSLGISLALGEGYVEYFSVYGGLQMGIGLAMILVTAQPKLLIGGLFFSLVMSAVLAVSRVVGMAVYGSSSMMWVLLILEGIIAISLAYQWIRLKPQ